MPDVLQKINGILLVNKHQGLTSNAILQRAKRLLHAQKAGHTGSLDPLATGMLPLCFGEATKFSQYLLDADKCYEATGHLGITTNSGDSTGEIVARVDDVSITAEELMAVLPAFTGAISQVPPMFSALKHQGTPLYKLARAGIEIERRARDVVIYKLQLLSFDNKQFRVRINCSKGTYVRSLIEGIGNRLGVGAHVTQLHRSYTAGFANAEMFTLEELAIKSPAELQECLLPMDRALVALESLSVTSAVASALQNGKVVCDIVTNTAVPGIVKLYENGTNFIGLGELSSSGELKVKRLCQL